MNRATKAAIFSIQANQFDLKAAFFHSTPVLDRKRRSHYDYKGNAYAGSSKRANYYRNSRKLNSKQELLRNVSAFAENLFQGLDYDVEYEYEHEPSSSRGRSWFRTDYRDRGFKSGGNNRKGSRAGERRGFQFCEDDDDDVETLFRSAFGGNKYFFWSFVDDEPHRSSTGYHNNNSHSWNWKWTHGENYDTDSDSSPSDLTTERKALGLSTSGPLNADDVKNAYRKCAMKWHPDRHQGSSKAVAEEKFKVCSAAYQTLCDKLAVN